MENLLWVLGYTLLAPVINERIHNEDDYLPDCLSVMVVARVML